MESSKIKMLKTYFEKMESSKIKRQERTLKDKKTKE